MYVWVWLVVIRTIWSYVDVIDLKINILNVRTYLFIVSYCTVVLDVMMFWKKNLFCVSCMSDYDSYKKSFFYILWLLMYYLRKYTEWCSDAPSAIFSSTVRHYGSRSIKNSRQKLNDTKTYVITYVELQSGKLINKM